MVNDFVILCFLCALGLRGSHSLQLTPAQQIWGRVLQG